ncbi:MAG: hypothetical protein ACE5F6_15965 [Anaerolineae bacterium]
MTDIERNDVVEMAARTRCAICKTPYGRRGVRLVGRRGRGWTISVTCMNCGSVGRMFASVDATGAGGSIRVDYAAARKPRIMYDVTYDEWWASQQRPPVSSDDVLDIHRFLQNFDGDFARLFGEERNIEDTLK